METNKPLSHCLLVACSKSPVYPWQELTYMSTSQVLQLLPKVQIPGMSGNDTPGASLHMSNKTVTISGKSLQQYAWIQYRGSRGEKNAHLWFLLERDLTPYIPFHLMVHILGPEHDPPSRDTDRFWHALNSWESLRTKRATC